MMKFILFVFSIFFGGFSFSQDNSYRISGKISGLDGKEMRIVIYDLTDPKGYKIDNIQVVNESFSYSGSISEYSMVTISPGVPRVLKGVKSGGYYSAKSSLLSCFVFPGAKIEFAGKITDFVDAYPDGDNTNRDFAVLNRQIFPVMNKSYNAQVIVANKDVTDPAKLQQLKDSMEWWDNSVNKIRMNFLNTHLSSVVSAWLLADMMLRQQIENEEAIRIFNLMDKKLELISFYRDVSKRVNGIIMTRTGNKVPDIVSFRTPDSTKFELSKLRGKYLVIDFWGTWCGPCMQGMPKLKEYYTKYSGKLNILGIASESDNGKRWRSVIKDKQLNWYNLLSNNSGDEDYVLKFSIAGFPTKFIIDPDGKILGRYVGEDESIYTELDRLLKK